MVAGCVWKTGTQADSAAVPRTLLQLPESWYGINSIGNPVEGYQMSTIYDTAYTGPPVTAFERVDGRDFVCYRPLSVR